MAADDEHIQLVGEAVNDVNLQGVHMDELFKIATGLVTWISVGSMIFGGIVPYIPQYRSIGKTRDAEGFSTFVCLVLLIANILRILFWFGKRYELPLLIQSVIMIMAMLAMIHICIQVRADEITVARRITDFNIEYFWKWTHFGDYCVFIGAFSLVGCLVTILLIRVTVYIEIVGLASLLLEACLGVPQFWRNFNNKSTEGMSIQMVCMWLSGDMFKTVYFVLRESPVQFWLCGSIQIMVDILILIQVFLYWKRTSSASKQSSRPH